ncbi:CHASE2 domain-containing protein [Leptolyngbya sp. Heron Island J]|uniref:CHASE2 domain-containing protein n=1 Tax=Leptolyngbya sp. Heron Island J TaxID=1385935 RepID=UPI000686147E|nr:CHASE2 domain-containing protein [Leptolyngbya sp. Heron Island J]
MKHWLCKSGWRLLPGLLVAGLTLIAARTDIGLSLEHRIYSHLFGVRGERPWDDRVTLIEIDGPSLTAIGQFPWPRHYYTDLLNRLALANSSVIAFDILFAESTDSDPALAEAMAHHGNVVLATAWNEQRGVIGPNADVVEGAIATGHIHYHADADGITRTYPSRINGIPALSIAAVQRYADNPTLENSDLLKQNLWLNWRGLTQSAPRYSFVDVLSGEVPASTFANKIVFIGFTGVGLDAMATPYDQTPPTAGVYQHIVAANNLLAQTHLKPIIWPIWAMFMLLSPALGYWLSYQRLGVYGLANVISIVVWGSAVILAFNHNYWMPSILPVSSVVATSLLTRLTQRLQENAGRQQQLSKHAQSTALTRSLSLESPMGSQQSQSADYGLPGRLDRCS